LHAGFINLPPRQNFELPSFDLLFADHHELPDQVQDQGIIGEISPTAQARSPGSMNRENYQLRSAFKSLAAMMTFQPKRIVAEVKNVHRASKGSYRCK
jgi:hypothetical protein